MLYKPELTAMGSLVYCLHHLGTALLAHINYYSTELQVKQSNY